MNSIVKAKTITSKCVFKVRHNIVLFSISAHTMDFVLSLFSAGFHYKDWMYTKDGNINAATLTLRIFGILLEVSSIAIIYILNKGLENNCSATLKLYMILQPICVLIARMFRYIIIFAFADWKMYLAEKQHHYVINWPFHLFVFSPLFFICSMLEWILVRSIRHEMTKNALYLTEESSKTKMLHDSIFVEKHLVYGCSDIIYEETVGEGWSSKVFAGRLQEGSYHIPVAIKKLKTNTKEEYVQGIHTEIKMLSYVGKHEHIVEFFGIYQDQSDKDFSFCFILEFCSNGNLESFLRENKHLFLHQQNHSCDLQTQSLLLHNRLNDDFESDRYYTNIGQPNCSFMVLFRFSLEIAQGMEYLSSRKIIHGDLAARNILLDENMSVKISDFGLSLHLYRYMTYLRCNEYEEKPLPWRWMSIEALEDLKFSEKSDVWSFGITLWEIFTLGDIPFKDMHWNTSLVDDLKSGKLKLEHPKYGTPDVCQIIAACINHNHTLRPNFSSLVVHCQGSFGIQDIG